MYGKDRDGIGRPVLVEPSGQLFGMSNLANAAINGRIFSVATQTVVASSAALTTTFTGLAIGNPSGSGKIAIMHEFGWALKKKPDGESAIGLMTATIGDIADSLTARPGYGSSTSAMYADAAATPGTPVLERVYESFGESENWIHSPLGGIDLKGSICLAPGKAVLTYTSKAFAECYFHFVWEEIDV